MWFLIIIAVIVIVVLISRESKKTNNKEVDLKVKAAVLSAAPNFKYRCDYADTANHIRISYLVSNDCKSISFVSTKSNKIVAIVICVAVILIAIIIVWGATQGIC